MCVNLRSVWQLHIQDSAMPHCMLPTQPCTVHIFSCHCAPCLTEKPLSFLCFSFKLLLSNLLLHSCILSYIHVLMTDVQKMQPGSSCTECHLCCYPGTCVCLQVGEKKGWLWNGSKPSSTKLLNLINLKLSQ